MTKSEDPESSADEEATKLVIKALFKAVEDTDQSSSKAPDELSCQPLIRLLEPTKCSDTIVSGLTPKQQRSLILKTIRQSLPKSSAKRFFSGLKSILEDVISEQAYIPDSAFEEEAGDKEATEKGQAEDNDKSTECLTFLKLVAECVQAFLDGRSNLSKRASLGMQLNILPQVYDVAADLHNILLSLHDCGPESVATQAIVLNLCESWWLANAINRDTLIAQCLPLLVVQALDGKDFTKPTIKRLYKIKDAFSVIDFTNPSSDSLRQLLLRVASNPLCLRMVEGKKFLASLFQDPDLVVDFHLAFRAQIPEASKSILQAYGDIYHRAWKEAAEEEEIRDSIEHQALQDLMHAAIHVSSAGTQKSILAVLDPIHTDKKTPAVAQMLYRLYSPILWRSLTAANPFVRKNAVTVLEQVFPLQDPSQNHVKAAVEKCAAALKSALQDSDPRVRVEGSKATARICGMFWDALPAAGIRMLLNHIVMEHASDSSSSAVRAAALEATTILLKAPQSHGVLRALLPSLGNLIHDKAEKVRVSAVKLLLRIKETPGIRFYHVVPVDHLTARLAEENRLHRNPRNPVAKELTALMLNSYFPPGSATNQLQRALTFMLSDPSAAAVFYANLASHLETESVAKFICMLLACLKAAVDNDRAQQIKNYQKRKKRRRRPSDNEGDKADSSENHNLSASNTPLMASLTETIWILLQSIEESLEGIGNEGAKVLLTQRLVEAGLVNMLSHFERKVCESQSDDQAGKRDECLRSCSAILRCAGWLPRDAVTGIVSFISSSLASLCNESADACRHVSSHLALLCLWGMTNEVASALASSIDSAFGDDITLMSPCFDVPRRRRRSSGRTKKDDDKVDIPVFPPKIAWSIVDSILQGSDPSSASVREAILSSSGASSSIEAALERGTEFAERLLAADSAIGGSFKEEEVEFILCSCEAYGRFALHREAHNGDELGFNRQAKLLLDWTTENVLPALLGAQSGETELRDLDLSRISNVSDSLIMPGSPLPMSPPKQKANLRHTPGRLSSAFDLDSNPAVFLVSAVARSLLQSSCVVFAELLAVGGSCADNIAKSAVEWCKIFKEEEMDSDSEGHKFVQREILPSFFRLAVQLVKSSENTMLLKELFIKCDEQVMEDESVSLRKAVSSLLISRSREGAKLVDAVIDTFFSAAEELLDSADMEISFKVAASADQVWNQANGCLATVLEAIVCNRAASLGLAKILVSDLKQSGAEMTKKSTFDAKCLSFLMSSTEFGAPIARVVNDLDVENFAEDGELRVVVEKLVESTT